MGKLRLEILTPRDVLLDLEGLSWLQVPLTDGGGIGILPQHAPLIAATEAGRLRYATSAGEEQFDAPAGILKVRRDVVTIFVSSLPENGPLPIALGRSSRLTKSTQAASRIGARPDG